MALIRDYELPGTGVVVANAYHVVTSVDVEKRIADILPPPDSSRPDGLTAGARGPEVYWKAGYIGKIAVTVWKDAAARANNATPLGFIGVHPTDNKYNARIGPAGSDHTCNFFIDINSADNHITQAYNHLRTTDYYANATED
jgi:hypothetical protein